MSTIEYFSTGLVEQRDLSNALDKSEGMVVSRIDTGWSNRGTFCSIGDRFVRIFDKRLPEIRSAAVTQKGDVWIATERGLFKCTRDSIEFISLGKGRSSEWGIQTVAVVGETIWVGRRSGLVAIDSNGVPSGHSVAKNNPLPSRSVRALAADGKGGLWVGTGRGLLHLDPDGHWGPVVFSDSSICRVFVDSLGVLVSYQKGYKYEMARLYLDGKIESFQSNKNPVKNNLKRNKDGILEISKESIMATDDRLGGHFVTSREPSKWSIRTQGGTVLFDNSETRDTMSYPNPIKSGFSEISAKGAWVTMYSPDSVVLVNTE